MKNLLKLGVLLLLGSVLTASALAGPGHGIKPPKCPYCHMQLSIKKTKMMSVPVRLKKGGPIYFCCSMCKMPAWMRVKPAVWHHPVKRDNEKMEHMRREKMEHKMMGNMKMKSNHMVAMKCPACGMVLSPRKDKMHPIAVKVHGKTMYCCSGCKMKR